MIIPDESVLKTLKTYLPYVCICVLAWLNYHQFNLLQQTYEQRIKDKQDQSEFWRDAYTRTTEVLNEKSKTDYEWNHQNGDSSSHSTTPRQRPAHQY